MIKQIYLNYMNAQYSNFCNIYHVADESHSLAALIYFQETLNLHVSNTKE